jgi:hypothetical protein
MITRRLLLACAAAVVSGPLAAQAADPAAIVQSIYARGTDPYGAAVSLQMRAPHRRALSQSLAALWKRSDDGTPDGDEPVPGFDIASNSQGIDVTSVDVTVESQDAARATVAATLKSDQPFVRNDPKENIVRYDFIRENGRWKIDDVRSFIKPKEWSIKRTLSESLKGQ